MGWIFVAAGVVIFLAALIDQRLIWRKTAAWQYKNPEAHEPSDAYFVLQRAGLIVSGPALAVVGLVISSHTSGPDADLAGEPRAVVDKLAAAIQADGPLTVYLDSYAGAGGPPGTMPAAATKLVDRELQTYDFRGLSRAEGQGTATATLFTITAGNHRQYCLHVTVTGAPTTSSRPGYSWPNPGGPPVSTAPTPAAKSWPMAVTVTDGWC